MSGKWWVCMWAKWLMKQELISVSGERGSSFDFCFYGQPQRICYICKGSVCIRAKWPIRLLLVEWNDLEFFFSPLHGMLLHCSRVIPSITCQFTSIHLYPWVERGTVRVMCLTQEHNTMSLDRAWTWTDQSGDECEASMPPQNHHHAYHQCSTA